MATKLYVSDGRVNCPRRGDIDVDNCLGCPSLSDMGDEGGETIVVCKGRSWSSFDHLVAARYGYVGRAWR